jgi:hypothetical protein
MRKSILDDPEHWRERAEEARTIAEQMHTEDAKRQMLSIARGYDRMAEHAEARLLNKVAPAL